MGIVLGIAFLVTSVIIAFVVISNVADVHEPLEAANGYGNVTNETGTAGAWLNDTGYNLSMRGVTGFTSPVIVRIYNLSNNDDTDVDVGNSSVTDDGVLTNGTTLSGDWGNISVSYTYRFKETTTSVEQIQSNFSTGITNVANKLPTVLLITAVVIVLGILSILWSQYKRMQIGGNAEI